MLTMSMTMYMANKKSNIILNNVEKVRNKKCISSNSRNNISIVKSQII